MLGGAIFLATGVTLYDIMGFDPTVGVAPIPPFIAGGLAFCAALVRAARANGGPLSVTLCCPAYATPPAAGTTAPLLIAAPSS
jgi:hypothetical protein